VNDLHSKLKVFSPTYDAIGWGFDYPQVVDLATALAQPIRIAALPVYYENPKMFSWRPEFEGIDITQFDLVLFTDIEYRRQAELLPWIESTGCKNWLLCVGGLYASEPLSERVVHRTPWSFNFLEWNPVRDDFPLDRPFMWECLHGTRRAHRDYVMLAFQESGLLDRSIVTYRDIFVGAQIDQTPDNIQACFPNTKLAWPYVSTNLDPSWEVRGGKLDNSISGEVPWDIWNRCYYSIMVETLNHGDCFLMAEKAGKCFFARRLFVHFGIRHYLKNLHELGFQTFDNVIDESYDSIETDLDRWQAAFDQVKALSLKDPKLVLEQIRPILDHNHNRLFALKEEKRIELTTMVLDHLK
jgi:hypothetical protein